MSRTESSSEEDSPVGVTGSRFVPSQLDGERNDTIPEGLPNELMLQIAKLLYFKDLQNLGVTCRAWKAFLVLLIQDERATYGQMRLLKVTRTTLPNEDSRSLDEWVRKLLASPDDANYVERVDVQVPFVEEESDEEDDNGDGDNEETDLLIESTEPYVSSSAIRSMTRSNPALIRTISETFPCWQRLLAGSTGKTNPRQHFWDLLGFLLPLLPRLVSLKITGVFDVEHDVLSRDYHGDVDFHKVIGEIALSAQQSSSLSPQVRTPLMNLRRLEIHGLEPALFYPLMALPTVEVVHINELEPPNFAGEITYPDVLPLSRAKAVVIYDSYFDLDTLPKIMKGLQGPCVVLQNRHGYSFSHETGFDWRSVVIPYTNAPPSSWVTVRKQWENEEVFPTDPRTDTNFDRLIAPWEGDSWYQGDQYASPDIASYWEEFRYLLDPTDAISHGEGACTLLPSLEQARAGSS